MDTVNDADRDALRGTGLTFPATAEGLGEALQRALVLHADAKRYSAVQKRGMEKNFSWTTAAAAYEQLYQDSL